MSFDVSSIRYVLAIESSCDETAAAVIDSDLFMVEDDSCEEVDDEDIDEFLQRAGLLDARPQRPRNDDGDLSTARRRRWVYGDVIYDAVGLVEEKPPPPRGRLWRRHRHVRAGHLRLPRITVVKVHVT